MNIKILVATHKPYPMPRDTSLYLPVQVGCDETDVRLGYTCDNTGDNISYKHRFYSDLSSLYWGWKNVDSDYLGTCHYRRFFVSRTPKSGDRKDIHRYILSREELETLLAKCPVIVPPKRRYYIETIRSHYEHAHNPRDLQATRDALEKLFPEYLAAFDKVLNRTSQHLFNTFIMDRLHMDTYCNFLFPLLEEIGSRIDVTGYDAYQERVLGYIGERMLDVWLEANGIEYQEVRLALLERPNWLRKGYSFVRRKFFPTYRDNDAAKRRVSV